MKTIKPANTHLRAYQLENSDTNRMNLPRYAQVLGAAFDATRNAVIVTVAWSPDSDKRETREFLTVSMDRARVVPAGVLTHIATVTVPGHAPVVVFEVGSPEEKRARVRIMQETGPLDGSSVRVNNHAGNIGPGGSLVQAGTVHGGIHR